MSELEILQLKSKILKRAREIADAPPVVMPEPNVYDFKIDCGAMSVRDYYNRHFVKIMDELTEFSALPEAFFGPIRS